MATIPRMTFTQVLRAQFAIAVLVGAALVVAGCAGSDDADSDGGSAFATSSTDLASQLVVDVPEDKVVDLTDQDVVHVDVIDNAFRPQFFAIREGATVTFENQGNVEHDIAPDVDGAFEQSGRLKTGDVFDLTPDLVGGYGFYCTIHGVRGKDGQPGRLQAGAVQVVAADDTPASGTDGTPEETETSAE